MNVDVLHATLEETEEAQDWIRRKVRSLKSNPIQFDSEEAITEFNRKISRAFRGEVIKEIITIKNESGKGTELGHIGFVSRCIASQNSLEVKINGNKYNATDIWAVVEIAIYNVMDLAIKIALSASPERIEKGFEAPATKDMLGRLI